LKVEIAVKSDPRYPEEPSPFLRLGNQGWLRHHDGSFVVMFLRADSPCVMGHPAKRILIN
jgi:hypothetical protein